MYVFVFVNETRQFNFRLNCKKASIRLKLQLPTTTGCLCMELRLTLRFDIMFDKRRLLLRWAEIWRTLCKSRFQFIHLVRQSLFISLALHSHSCSHTAHSLVNSFSILIIPKHEAINNGQTIKLQISEFVHKTELNRMRVQPPRRCRVT